MIFGAAIAIQAVAIVFVYRTHRIINFAQLQLGAISSALFFGLVQFKEFIHLLQGACPTCLGGSVSAAPTWAVTANFLLSLVVCLALAGVLGFVIYQFVVRPFKRWPPLILTVATIALGQLLAGVAGQVPSAVFYSLFGESRSIAATISPPVDLVLSIDPVQLRLADLTIVGAAVAVFICLALFLHRTLTGILLRGSGDHAERAETLGVNVDRLSGVVWTLAGFLSGLILMLSELSNLGVSSTLGAAELTSLVGILAAVVIARMSRLWLTVAAAVVLGVVQQVVLWITHTSALYLVTALALITSFLLLQRAHSSRAEQQAEAGWRTTKEVLPIPRQLRRLPPVRNYRAVAIGLVLLLAVGFPWVSDPRQTNYGTVTLIYALVGLSLLVVTGWAGQISLGQWGLAAVGAYIAELLTGSWGVPFPICLVAGGLAGSIAAVALGLPALRLRGLHLAVTTLAFGAAVTSLLLNQSYGGRFLPTSLSRPSFLGVSTDDERVFYYMALVVVGAAIATTIGLRRSPIGRGLIASRDNEEAAQLFGTNVTRLRLLAFSVSGFYAGSAGALFAFHQYGAHADAFDPQTSLTLFLVTVFGGMGAISGPLLGAVAYTVITLGAIPGLDTLGIGAMVLVMLLFFPTGLSGVVFSLRDALLRRVARRYHVMVPSLLAERTSAAGEPLPLAPLAHRGGAAVFVPERYALPAQWGLPPSSRAPSRSQP